MDSKNSGETPQPENRASPEGAGYWGAHVGGICSIVFAMAGGYLAAPLMTGGSPWQAWLAIPGGIYIANMFSKASGHMAGSEFKNPADSLKMANLTRSLILFTSLAAGYVTFIMAGEADKLRTQLHDAGAVRENNQQLKQEAPKTPAETPARKWQPEASAPLMKLQRG